MKRVLLSLTVLLSIGCAQTANHQDPVIPDNDVVLTTTTCTHKYAVDPHYTFTYVGEMVTTNSQMFGEGVIIHAFRLTDGSGRVVTDNELVNYICI